MKKLIVILIMAIGLIIISACSGDCEGFEPECELYGITHSPIATPTPDYEHSQSVLDDWLKSWNSQEFGW